MVLSIDELTATAAVIAKIEAKHRVTLEEAEHVVFGRGHYVRRGTAGLYLVYGRTAAGRYLVVVIAVGRRKARLITARDMTWRERRSYAKQAHT